MVATTVNLNAGKEMNSPGINKQEKSEGGGGAVSGDIRKRERIIPIRIEGETTVEEPLPKITPVAEIPSKMEEVIDNVEALRPIKEVEVKPEAETVNSVVSTTPSIAIKVKDFAGVLGTTEAQVFVVSPATKLEQFFVDVASRFNIELGEFDIIYQDKEFSYNLGGLPGNSDISGLNITPVQDKVYWMSLDVKQSKKEKPKAVVQDADINSVTLGLEQTHIQRDFVGLKNRNMTCYLNSFLQGLFFTPEFRNMVYNFKLEEGRTNRKSLCLPLQKLFLQLQLSGRDSVETDDLIKTFGWEDRETWNQHDIEELCSVFMDNLTKEFRGTPMEGIIQALYFGQLDDYVKCLNCEKVSQRTDDFLVVPLPIRNFGCVLPNPTLEAALKSFVAYEKLDGNNMYNCSQCEKPCEAHKGFKFNKLPYILSIQLKRFEYDFIKDRRFKLNDRVVFPFVLDMNPFVENSSPDRRESLKIDLLRPPSMVDGRKEGHSRPSVQMNDPDANVTEGASGDSTSNPLPPSTEMMRNMVKEKGPEIYQLFAVMIHRGSINSGHYYAYISDFERGLWFRCDDAIIRKASLEDIESAYGGPTEDDRELSSAYMLLYRRFDPDLNLLPYYLKEMPENMQNMWQEIIELDKKRLEEDELVKNTVRMACLMKDPSTQEIVEKSLQIPKTMTIADAIAMISHEFADVLPQTDINSSDKLRLCRFDKDLFIIEASFDGLETENIVDALEKLPTRAKNESLFLEVKKTGLPFQLYTADDIIFKTYLVDCRRQLIFPCREIHAQPVASVNELKEIIINEMQLGVKVEELTMVANCMGQFTTIIGDKHPLTLFNLQRINELYIEPGTDEELSDAITHFIDRYQQAEVMQLFVQLPANSPVVCTSECATLSPPVISINAAPEKKEHADPTPGDKNDVSVEVESTAKGETKTEDFLDPAQHTVCSKCEGIVGLLETTALKKTGPFIQIFCRRSCEEENLLVYTLKLDGQLPLYTLSKYVSAMISVPETDFVFYKVDKSETSELRRMTDRIATIKPFDHVFIKLEKRLQDGEARVPIYLLHVGNMEKPIEYLTEIVATMEMNIDDVRSAILDKCQVYQCDPSFDKSRLRIRKKLRSNPSKIMREKMKLKDLFSAYSIQSAELFVQLVDGQPDLTENNYALMYRAWHPSIGQLDPPQEVVIFHDYSEEVEDVILAKILESLGIGPDEKVELEVAKPDGCCYPWDVPHRLIKDLAWFTLAPSSVKKSLYIYTDELILFIRDKSEPEIDLESLPTPTRTVVPCGPESPKKETGLKLNLSEPSTPSK